MADKNKILPSYEKPPVVEVVCGVLFDDLHNLAVPHFGLLWQKFAPEYPNCMERPPLAPQVESFANFEPPATPSVIFSGMPPLPRIWFTNVAQTEIIQIQRDRLLTNWKKASPEHEYPRYHQVINLFTRNLATFNDFVTTHKLGKIIPKQYEMTYVNLIPKNEGWSGYNDIGNILPDFSWRDNNARFLPGPEKINFVLSFVLPDYCGRLHVSIVSAKRLSDDLPVIQVTLTARGMGADDSPDSMQKWFDLAREWIVMAFTDLIGSDIQRDIWRRLA